jgi:hypothetical protein
LRVRAEFTQEVARRFRPPPQPVCRSELATASEAETPEQRRQVALTRERIGYRLVRSAQASAAMPPSPAAAIIAVITALERMFCRLKDFRRVAIDVAPKFYPA